MSTPRWARSTPGLKPSRPTRNQHERLGASHREGWRIPPDVPTGGWLAREHPQVDRIRHRQISQVAHVDTVGAVDRLQLRHIVRIAYGLIEVDHAVERA